MKILNTTQKHKKNYKLLKTAFKMQSL